jgi:conjugative transposon TraN protein
MKNKNNSNNKTHYLILKNSMCMKKNSVTVMIGIFLLLLSVISASAQKSIGRTETAIIEPTRLAITYSKTTNLVFPYAIKSIDRGSQEILVQKAIGVENILQVKAAKASFKETNLTVVTSDGSLYSYILNYSERPTELNIRISNMNKNPEPLAVFSKDATTGEIERTAEEIAVKRRSNSGNTTQKHDLVMDVKGIYIHKDMLYFQLVLNNNSSISYDINMLRFAICDKKKSKRTASQEIELVPAYTYGNADEVKNIPNSLL